MSVEEQAALRRVATLVARGAPPPEVFAAVTEEAGRLVGADLAGMSRYDPDDAQTVVAAWPADREHIVPGTRLPVSEGVNLARSVRETGRSARVDDWAGAAGPVADEVRELGVRASVASPIVVAGSLWGLMIVDSRRGPFPDGTEERLAGFTELVATAVANSEAAPSCSGWPTSRRPCAGSPRSSPASPRPRRCSPQSPPRSAASSLPT